MPERVPAPILIFAWGNPSRGDDALGPLFLERAAQRFAMDVASNRLELLTDFQLQVEHALDLAGRTQVLFVDASLSAPEPFSVSPVAPARDASFTSHCLSPAAVLHAYKQTHPGAPPEARTLAIRGYAFELGEPPSIRAETNLQAALDWVAGWLAARIDQTDTAYALPG